jgi:hypothetical protein
MKSVESIGPSADNHQVFEPWVKCANQLHEVADSYAITLEIIAFVACLCGYHAYCAQAPQESLRLDLSS